MSEKQATRQQSQVHPSDRLAMAATHAECWQRCCHPADVNDMQRRKWKHLIEAAPDLLEALQCITANAQLAADPRMKNATDCYLVPCDDIEAASAAIAKATAST